MENKSEYVFSALCVIVLGLILGVAVPQCVDKSRQAILKCVEAGRDPMVCRQGLQQ